MASEIVQEVLDMIEAEANSRPTAFEFELAYQARVAIDRIRFAIQHTERYAPRTDHMWLGFSCSTHWTGSSLLSVVFSGDFARRLRIIGSGRSIRRFTSMLDRRAAARERHPFQDASRPRQRRLPRLRPQPRSGQRTPPGLGHHRSRVADTRLLDWSVFFDMNHARYRKPAFRALKQMVTEARCSRRIHETEVYHRKRQNQGGTMFEKQFVEELANAIAELISRSPSPGTKRLLTLPEAAEYIGRSPKAVERLIQRGAIPVTKIDGKRQVDRAALDKIIADRTFFEM